MTALPPLRRLQKLFHAEGMPWPLSQLYNALSTTHIFQHYYDRMAADCVQYCSVGSLLDIGAGPGWLLVKLHNHAPDLRLTGLDISPAMVARARRNMAQAGLTDRVSITQGSADDLPFADSSFDLVVSTGSIHHWKRTVESLNDIHRVLRPGGYALIYDLVRDTPTPLLKETAREFGSFLTAMMWLHGFEEPFYRIKELEELALETAFVEGRLRFVGVMGCLEMKKKEIFCVSKNKLTKR